MYKMAHMGIICKTGIPKTKAIEFVLSLFPTWTSATEEVTHAAGWAYTHNQFGRNRMKFKSHKCGLYTKTVSTHIKELTVFFGSLK